jgi:hypothetical protein
MVACGSELSGHGKMSVVLVLVGRATEAKSWTWYYLFVVLPGVLGIRYTLPRDIG